MSKEAGFAQAAALVALGAALAPAAETVVAAINDATSSRSAEAEALYREWLDMAEARIVAEQALQNRYRLETISTTEIGEAEVFQVIRFFDRVGSLIATGETDAPDLSQYMSEDRDLWFVLLSDLRDRSRAASDSARYRQLERAIAGVDLLFGGEVGHPSNLAIDELQTEWIEQRHPLSTTPPESRLRVTGRIANIGRVPNITPALVADVQDENGASLQRILIKPPLKKLQPGDAINFERLLPTPPEGDFYVSVTVATPADILKLEMPVGL